MLYFSIQTRRKATAENAIINVASDSRLSSGSGTATPDTLRGSDHFPAAEYRHRSKRTPRECWHEFITTQPRRRNSC
ncbi:hypothetical protein KCP78_17315 [Salmonella enterica subsp. enterica]|nr:hypothetical protein KCP78_17315 [Salmonella enterica subsp. enterica]